MRFLRRGPSGEPLEMRLAQFWAWWAGAKDGLARDITAGRVAGRADEISRAVGRIDERLAWELAKGSASEHMLVVTPEGNAEIRPIAIAWHRSAPPPDATWEYHASRQPGPPATLQIGPTTVELAEMRALTEWDPDRELLSLRLWHQAFAEAPGPVHKQVAFLFVDNLLGEDQVERWIGAIELDPSARGGKPPADVAAEVQQHAASATGDRWALAEGTDDRGNPVIVRLLASLKRIDHPFAADHLQVVVQGGLADAADRGRNASIAAAEEDLLASLAGVAIEAAHVTDQHRRTTHFVAEDGQRALSIARDWASRHPELRAAPSVEADPHWGFRRAYGG